MTPEIPPERPEFLPRSPLGRAVVASLALPVAAFFGILLYIIIRLPMVPQSLGAAIAAILISDFVLSAFLVSMLAFIWGVATPQWIATLLEKYVLQFLLVVAACLVALILGLWISRQNPPIP